MRSSATTILLLLLGSTVRAGDLDLKIVDAAGKEIPCRVLVRPVGGDCVVPDGKVVLPLGPDRWFMAPGKAAVNVPDGRVELRVERGLEYVPHREFMEVLGDTLKVVSLRRWVNMRELGYLAGENHLHEPSTRLGPLLAAEDLDFGTSLTWWNGPDRRRPIPREGGPVTPLTFAGRIVPTTVYDAELEHAWGAAYIQNLPRPFTLRSDPARPNLDFLRQAVQGGAIVHYQAGWSREVGVSALLGLVHTVNVCNNNFSRHRFQPRTRYSNLLKVEGFPEYPGTDVGMMRMNTDTYYRLLNWGLRLAAGAGSATGVKEAPVGYNRAYVRAPGGAGVREFNAAWRDGKNFVTNGPMIFLETSRGFRPGDTVALPDGGGAVAFRVKALSAWPLQTVEVVVNGEVKKSFEGTGGTVDLEIRDGSWVAARCTARDGLLTEKEISVYSRGDGDSRFPIRPSTLRFAHTSPIYVTVGERGAAVRKSIEEGLRMMDAFAAFARNTASEPHRESILDAARTARMRLELLLENR